MLETGVNSSLVVSGGCIIRFGPGECSAARAEPIQAARDPSLRTDAGRSRSLPSTRGTTRAEYAQGTPTQSHISPSILVYGDEVLSRYPRVSLNPNPQTRNPQQEQAFAVDKVFKETDEFKVFFFFTLITGPRRSLSLKLSDTRVYEPQIRVQGRLT